MIAAFGPHICCRCSVKTCVDLCVMSVSTHVFFLSFFLSFFFFALVYVHLLGRGEERGTERVRGERNAVCVGGT